MMATSESLIDSVPMGYKFRPRDDELLGYYLLNKVRSTRFMYDHVVPEVDLYGTLEPWQIWYAFGGQQLEKGEKDLYFFTKLKRVSATDSRTARSIGTGTWLGENAQTAVRDPQNNQLLGTWKRFHYKNTKPNHQDGCWIMHEYRLASSIVKKLKSSSTSCPSSTSTSTNDVVDEDQVLCRLRINTDKKRKMKDDDDIADPVVLLQSQSSHHNNKIQKKYQSEISGNHSDPHEPLLPPQYVAVSEEKASIYCSNNYCTGQSDNVVGVGPSEEETR